jgi:hypothetical protein
MSSKSIGQTASSTPLILTPQQAAAQLNLSSSWLAKARLKGDGPAYIKMGGAVRYSATVLHEWMKSKQRLSTSGG